MRLDFAQRAASELVAELEPHCHRIEIAGSIRRQEPTVKDIEIVCVPYTAVDLFGNPDPSLPHEVRRHLEQMLIQPRRNKNGHRIGWGQKFLAGELEDVPIDVFCVLPPAQWGAILAIRTGPAAYSKMLVTQALKRGMRCVDGRLMRPDVRVPVETPTEQSFFEALQLDYVDPTRRSS